MSKNEIRKIITDKFDHRMENLLFSFILGFGYYLLHQTNVVSLHFI